MFDKIQKFYESLPWVRKNREELKKVKFLLRYFFEGHPADAPISSRPMPIWNLGIFDIRIKMYNPLWIEIHLANPGRLIGKGGSTHKELTEFFEKWYNRRVQITLKEVKFWL